MTQSRANTPDTDSPLIVAVGASAGGLEAFQELLTAVGDSPNFAIIFVQHLDRHTKSLLAELLPDHTRMKVTEIQDGCRLAAGQVYVCPPQTLLNLHQGVVSVATADPEQRSQLSIDHFFQAVADDQADRGVGVILSGSGSDGTLGLKAISDRGGITFAQSSESAKFDSMPRSAATTGVADHVMSPHAIGKELLAYAQHWEDFTKPGSLRQKHTEIKAAIPTIAARLLEVSTHNFQHYKTNTLVRRIQRRMQILKIADVAQYVLHLQDQEDEVRLLFRELLIGVTAFFRDPDAFDSLKQNVLPKLLQGRGPDGCVRIWVAGCASGQEAYTIAMLCREAMEEIPSPCEVQIFATDIDERALQVARTGAYPAGIEEQITAARLKRFFIKRGKKYHVTKEIREMVLFSVHNLISDPPFSRQDLISCRNLLIYLGPHLQNKLIPLFHYALRPGGFLLLGPSENLTSHGELFRLTDPKHRISQRKGTAIGNGAPNPYRPLTSLVRSGGQSEPETASDLTEIRQRITLDEFAPKSVVIDQQGQILNASADMQKYLTVSSGNYQNNIVKMAARGLRLGLRAAIAEAIKIRRRVDHDNLTIRVGDWIQSVMLTVQPMPRLGEDESLFMVVFQDVGKPFRREENSAGKARTVTATDATAIDAPFAETHVLAADAMVVQLERELERTRDDLDKTLQDMEAANEELKSTNEELLSMNEELQSANEELETSKEEIRSSSDAIARANTDLENLLRSTQIATVFLDDQLNIRSFTQAIREIYELIPTDVGRPLERFVPLVKQMPPLPDPSTIQPGVSLEDTIIADSGRSYIRRILPYQSHTGDRDGIVVTFTDVTQLHDSQELFRLLVDASSQIVWLTDASGRVIDDSPSWRQFTGQSFDQWVNLGWLNALHPDDRGPMMKTWQQAVTTQTPIACEYRLRHHTGSFRWTQVRAVPQRWPDGSVKQWIGMNIDIDDQRRAQQQLIESKEQLRLGIEIANLALARIDYRQDTITLSPEAARLYGMGDSEMTVPREHLHQIFHPEDQAYVQTQVQNCLDAAGDGVCELDHRVIFPDGGERWISARKQISFDRSVSPPVATYATLVAKDITYRKVWELDLADREAYLRRVIDGTIAFIGVLQTDGTLREANAPALQAAGLQREDVIGRKFWDLYWWSFSSEVQQQIAALVRRAASGEFVRCDVMYRSEGDAIRPLDFMLNPICDARGKVTHLIPSAIDIHERYLAEQVNIEANAKLQALFDQSFYFTGILDLEGTLIEINRAGLEPFGFDRDQTLGQPFWQTPWWHLHSQSQDRLRFGFEAAMNGEIFVEDLSFARHDGQTGEFAFAFTPAVDGQGNIRFIIATGTDITQRKQRERDLAFITELQSHFAPLVAADEITRIAVARLSEYLQLSRCTVIDFADDQTQLSFCEDLHADGLADCVGQTTVSAFVSDAELQQLQTGKALVVDDGKTHSGKSAAAMQALIVSSYVMLPFVSENRLSSALLVGRTDLRAWSEAEIELLTEVTSRLFLRLARARAEARLAESERRLTMALKAGQMAAWEWNPNHSHWTEELYHLLGVAVNQTASPALFFERVFPDDLESLQHAWHLAVEGKDAYEAKFRIVRPDGEIRWLYGVGEVERDDHGQVRRIYGVNWDCTNEHLAAQAIQEARQQAEAANESKSAFLANMSHEIRTPMTAILGYAELLNEFIDDPQAGTYLQTIRTNGDFLLEIINDILDLSKIEAGKFEISVERFPPHRVVEDVRSIMEVRAKEKGISLHVDYGDQVPAEIESDPKRLKQILINLVGNAIKFTPSGSVNIVLRLREKSKAMDHPDAPPAGSGKLAGNAQVAGKYLLCIDIIDSGIGISQEQQRRLFRPFMQADGSVSREYGGTGLGLAISQRLTEMLGGQILIDSELGRGSKFSVHINTGDLSGVPRIKPETIQPSPDRNVVTATHLNARILVVDDRRDIRFLSKSILQKNGATIAEAEDGLSALQAVEQSIEQGQPFDLILLDMQMPKLDGYETAARLRRMGYTRSIIALTADAMQGDMSRCLQAGCNDYLSKPIDAQSLIKKVAAMTDR